VESVESVPREEERFQMYDVRCVKDLLNRLVLIWG